MAPKRKWYSVAEFSDYAGVGKTLIYEWMHLERNPLPAHRPAGGRWRIHIDEAERWMRSFHSTTY